MSMYIVEDRGMKSHVIINSFFLQELFSLSISPPSNRNLVEDWLEHYRIAMGISSPHLRTLPSAPHHRRRQAQSAKSSPAGVRVIIESISTQVPRPSTKHRAPSAPAGKPDSKAFGTFSLYDYCPILCCSIQ